MPLSPSFYEVLGVPTSCNPDDVRRAYHHAARQYHPDKRSHGTDSAVETEQQFLRVQEAYETLRNPERRRQYDAQLQHETLVRKREQQLVVVSDEVSLGDMQRVRLEGRDDEVVVVMYTHECRCGDVYEVSEHELEDGVDVVPCSGCSLHVRVVADGAAKR